MKKSLARTIANSFHRSNPRLAEGYWSFWETTHRPTIDRGQYDVQILGKFYIAKHGPFNEADFIATFFSGKLECVELKQSQDCI
jgi:hypothetical protein